MLARFVGLTSIHGSTSAPGKLTPDPSGGHAASGFIPEVRIGGPAFNGAAWAAAAETRTAATTAAMATIWIVRKAPPFARLPRRTTDGSCYADTALSTRA